MVKEKITYFALIITGPNTKKIAVVTVLKDSDNYDNYELAQNLFKCYAIYHKYQWIVVDISKNDTLQQLCPHKDVIVCCIFSLFLLFFVELEFELLYNCKKFKIF